MSIKSEGTVRKDLQQDYIIAAFNKLFDRMPDIRLDSVEPAPRIVGHSFRSPTRLPVVF